MLARSQQPRVLLLHKRSLVLVPVLVLVLVPVLVLVLVTPLPTPRVQSSGHDRRRSAASGRFVCARAAWLRCLSSNTLSSVCSVSSPYVSIGWQEPVSEETCASIATSSTFHASSTSARVQRQPSCFVG